MKGPLVKDWVNAQDRILENQVDITKTSHVLKSDEILWVEFEQAFKSAWKDTAKSQSGYNQLMKLTMRDLDVDTYMVMFERLAATAEWELDTKGTVAGYQGGLRENVH